MNPAVYRTIRMCGLLAASGLALFAPCAASAKAMRKDVVVMTNGDKLTGEVKSLQNGVLFVKTEYVSENIGLDWAQVKEVQSTAMYQITLVNGVHMKGKIKRDLPDNSQAEEITIESSSGSTHVSVENVAELSTQKDTFLRQLKGSLDAGYSFSSGNGQTTLNSDASATYDAPNWTAGAGIANSFSGQSDATRTNRIDATLNAGRFLSHNSYVGILNEYLHSSDQDLNLRTTLGGGYGRYWIRKNNTTFRWIAGVAYTWESFDTSVAKPSDSNVEALFGASYDAYRFKFGEIHLQGNVFPGLSDFGRVRATTNNSLRIKLVNNFYFSIGFWDNYDSRPPVTAKKNELGISSSIGWTF